MPLSEQQKQQLVEVFDEAQRTGDRAAMERVRQVLSDDAAAYGEQAAPARRPSFSEVMSTMTENEVGQAGATAEGLRDVGSGVVEGLRRLYGGVQQLGGNFVDLWRQLSTGEHFVHSPRFPAERSLALRKTNEEIMRRQTSALEAQAAGRAPQIREAVAEGTGLAALAVAPEMALPRATTMVGAALKNSAANMAGEMVMFDPGMDKGSDVLIAGAAAPVLGVIPSAGPAVLNFIGRHLTNVARRGRTQGAVESARQVLPNTDFSLAQVTGVPELKLLERAAYDSTLVNFYADQTDRFIDDFGQAFNQNVNADNLVQLIPSMQRRMDSALANMRRNASQAWDQGMAEASRLSQRVDSPQQPVPGRRDPEEFVQGGVPQTGDTPRFSTVPRPSGARVPVSNFSEQFRVVAAQARDRVARGGGAAPINEGWLSDVERMLRKGNLTAHETARLLKGLTSLQRSDNNVQRALGSQLRRALDTDLDLLEETAGAATDDAVKVILDTRAEYRRAMGSVEALGNSAAYKLMGVPDNMQDITADSLLARFTGLPAREQRQVAAFLNEHAPEMARTMKQAVVDDVIARSRTIRPASDSQQSLDNLTEALFDSKRGADLRTSGLWTGEELARMEGIRNGLRVIAGNRPEFATAGTPIKAEDITINLVSRHAGFLARQATRILMSARASEFFTDPQVHALLTQMNRSTTGSTANLAARVTLLKLLEDAYGQDPAQE